MPMQSVSCCRPEGLSGTLLCHGPAIQQLVDANGTYPEVLAAPRDRSFLDRPKSPPFDGDSPFFDRPQSPFDGGSPFDLALPLQYNGRPPFFDLPLPPPYDGRPPSFFDLSPPSPYDGRPSFFDLPPSPRQEELSLKELRGSITGKPSSIATFSPGSILIRDPPGWPTTFYIRIDIRGSFHTYPHVGGPFKSLQETDDAIDRHLNDRRCPPMCKEQDEASLKEMTVLDLYWPDGTAKKCSKSEQVEIVRNQMRSLVQALVDKYNEDHNLFGDLAYELKDVLHYQFIYESNCYYHLNFSTKARGADGIECGMDNLFFAELLLVQGEPEEMVVSCICMVKPYDNGHCYGCTINGSVDMKHPNNVDAYCGGHVASFTPFGFVDSEWSDSDGKEKAQETRIYYKGLGPDSAVEVSTVPLGVELWGEEA